jgi:broad specificity phosphatase PhoE
LEMVNEYIENGEFANVDIVVASTESKAIATAKPIAKFLNLDILEIDEFKEIGRSNKFLRDEEFLLQKKKQMTEMETKVDGGESGRDALERFKSGILKLENENEGKNILIVSHGTVMSFYFAELLGEIENSFERWEKLKFCALGKVENSTIIQDII